MKFTDLLGQTITGITVNDNEILFTLASGVKCKLFHQQECCEYVSIEDICGDILDLIGSPVLVAEESSNSDDTYLYDESIGEWTYYKLDTIKGGVTIRWYGSSNGYYGVSVDFRLL